MKEYKKSFSDFLFNNKAIMFGDFVTKSGRQTPYFINTGCFDSGEKLSLLGEFYALHILSLNLKPTVIFGPAYKGIPLCVSTSQALYKMGFNTFFSFNRKEVKDHGDLGLIVGHKIDKQDRIVIVEDVITAGITLKETVSLLRSFGDVNIEGIVIAVDRCEKGEKENSALLEVEKLLNVKIFPIVTIKEILDHLSSKISPQDMTRVKEYLKNFGTNG